MGLQKVIQFVAGFAGRAAGAPCVSIERHQANLVGGLLARAAANANGAVNQRQLMVFLQKDHQTVGQLHTARLLRAKLAQGRDGHLFPGAGRGRSGGSFGGRGLSARRMGGLPGEDERQRERKQSREEQSYFLVHCRSPLPGAAAGGGGVFGVSVSMTATVRLSSRKVLLATRRMSALVTLSSSSIWRKSSRQSP